MKLFGSLLVALMLAACAYPGTGADNPLVLRATWFSFLEGSDIAAGCFPGTQGRYRAVYNANYDEQVRIYELGDEVDPLRLQQRVLGEANLALAVNPFASLGPWRGNVAERRLAPQQYRQLIDAMTAAGAFGPPNTGLDLPSRGFYWTLAYCHQGRYGFNAWLWPDPDFLRLGFDRLLLALDQTGVPVNQPRAVPPRYHDFDIYDDFSLRVGQRGLWGTPY